AVVEDTYADDLPHRRQLTSYAAGEDHVTARTRSSVQQFLQQLPALIGVLLGAAATFTATTAAERARWRRAQAVRWDEKRLAAYSEYAHAMKKLISIAVQLATTRGVHPDAVTA